MKNYDWFVNALDCFHSINIILEDAFLYFSTDEHNKNFNLADAPNFLINIFKQHPSIAVFNHYDDFDGGIANLALTLRIGLIRNDSGLEENNRFLTRFLVDGCDIFYHPLVHRQIMFENITPPRSYRYPTFLESCMKVGYDDDENWFRIISEEDIKEAISKIAGIIDKSKDNTQNVLFTINTLMMLIPSTESLIATVMKALVDCEVPFFVALEELVSDGAYTIQWTSQQSFSYINFEYAASNLVIALVDHRNAKNGRFDKTTTDMVKQILKLMVRHEIAFLPFDGRSLNWYNDDWDDEKWVDNLAKIFLQKYNIPTDMHALDFKWMDKVDPNILFQNYLSSALTIL